MDGEYRLDSGDMALRWPARSSKGSRVFDSKLIANITVLSSQVVFEPFPSLLSIPFNSFLALASNNFQSLLLFS